MYTSQILYVDSCSSASVELIDPSPGGSFACNGAYTWDGLLNPTECELPELMTTDPPNCPVTYTCLGAEIGVLDSGCNKAGAYSFDTATGKFTLFPD